MFSELSVRRRTLLSVGTSIALSGCLGLLEGDTESRTDTSRADCTDPTSNWPSFQGGTGNRGASGSPGPRAGSSRVVADLSSGSEFGPVLYNETVLSSTGKTVTRTTPDGNREWQVTLDSKVENSIAVDCDRVFVQTRRKTRGLDPESGETVWQRSVSPSTGRASPIPLDDTFVAPDRGGAATAFSATDGTNAWQTVFERQSVNGLAATDDTVLVATGANGRGFVVALDRESGDEQWRTTSVGEIYTDPVVGPDNVYVLNTDAKLHALDPGSGTVQWRRSIETDDTGLPFLAVGEGDHLYFATAKLGSDSTGSILALARDDGTVSWETNVSRDNWISPVVTDETVYIGNAAGIHALDPSSGEIRWTLPDVPVRRPMCLGEEALYCHVGSELVAIE